MFPAVTLKPFSGSFLYLLMSTLGSPLYTLIFFLDDWGVVPDSLLILFDFMNPFSTPSSGVRGKIIGIIGIGLFSSCSGSSLLGGAGLVGVTVPPGV